MTQLIVRYIKDKSTRYYLYDDSGFLKESQEYIKGCSEYEWYFWDEDIFYLFLKGQYFFSRPDELSEDSLPAIHRKYLAWAQYRKPSL